MRRQSRQLVSEGIAGIRKRDVVVELVVLPLLRIWGGGPRGARIAGGQRLGNAGAPGQGRR